MPTQRLDNNQANRYTSASRRKRVIRHSGLFVLPVADEPPTDPELLKNWSPVQIVRAHAPYQVEVDEWEYEKEDAPPIVPDMTDAGHLTFLDGELSVESPSINTGGGLTWSVSGEYHFISTVPAQDLKKTGVVLGTNPYVLQSQREAATYPGPAYPGSADLPPEVERAGVGPRVGWQLSHGGAPLGGEADPTAPGYTYLEPTYLPATFFSDDLTVGPSDYSGMV